MFELRTQLTSLSLAGYVTSLPDILQYNKNYKINILGILYYTIIAKNKIGTQRILPLLDKYCIKKQVQRRSLRCSISVAPWQKVLIATRFLYS
jgi:hypothetical protein